MNRSLVIFSIISTITGIYVGFLLQRPVRSLCDITKCPYCYGTDLCEDITQGRIVLRYDTVQDLAYNLLSVKNVYFADYENRKVVLKKLAHDDELVEIKPLKLNKRDEILEFLNSDTSRQVRNLKSCDEISSELLLNLSLKNDFSFEQIWSIVQINPEPLVLSLFKSGDEWPVPELYGACGFLIVEEDCGRTLNHFSGFDWEVRAFLAMQLLEAAVNFTEKDENFRVYLTDLSPDNVAVDEELRVRFIDLENVILKERLTDLDRSEVHYSVHFEEEVEEEEEFVYDENRVCQSSISDHNIYAVCRLLLSQRAPWPMMQNGLLHSPPGNFRHTELFTLIEECVDPKEKSSRFRIAQNLINLLKKQAFNK